jgi:hypothetical protein
VSSFLELKELEAFRRPSFDLVLTSVKERHGGKKD